ncbi:uncharacterized protein ACHE_10980A [Aspergillus chevalieri]|uniref:Uncharacterized protein n=1 Tax=Aspergillus chevalieri TaxID=182096 RepID=A0A7R7VF59_ASPCH|nr:uncharacterized protein ACHE_10980A [Aspergillus chevalieri]BCR83578.1 hypothetical protein ACHE_10980A [Aspergillus chevalieri]
MNPTLHSSPPPTQITYTEHPVELKECREYLERLGMSPDEAETLLSSNRRESCYVDNPHFVNIMEQLIRTGKYGEMSNYDINALKIEWQKRNEGLEAQFNDVQTKFLLNSIDYLSTKNNEDAVTYMMRFIRSGANNYRIKFVTYVLPILLSNPPTPIPTHQHPTAEDPRTTQTPNNSKKRAPKSKAQPANVNLRRSTRIKRLQENSKKPASPLPTRRQNKKGKQVKEGRQVHRRL